MWHAGGLMCKFSIQNIAFVKKEFEHSKISCLIYKTNSFSTLLYLPHGLFNVIYFYDFTTSSDMLYYIRYISVI